MSRRHELQLPRRSVAGAVVAVALTGCTTGAVGPSESPGPSGLDLVVEYRFVNYWVTPEDETPAPEPEPKKVVLKDVAVGKTLDLPDLGSDGNKLTVTRVDGDSITFRLAYALRPLSQPETNKAGRSIQLQRGESESFETYSEDAAMVYDFSLE